MIGLYHTIQTGKGVFIHPSASIGRHVTIYDGVTIGANSVIGDYCTIGEPLHSFYTQENYIQSPTIIGANSLIRSHSIIYAGNQMDDYFSTGHRVTIRENNRFGSHNSIGTLSDIQGESVFGSYVRLHSSVHICQGSTLGNYVMIYPFVVFMNDRYPPTTHTKGPIVGDYTQVGVQSVLHSGVRIGENSLIGAQTSVHKDLAPFSFFSGNPGALIGDVRTIKDEMGNPLYPWPYRFDRGMPWSELGYDRWKEEK